MSIFKKLFGKTKKKKTEKFESTGLPKEAQEEFLRMMKQMSSSSNTPEEFKIELYDSLNRYYSNPELQTDLNLTDTDGTVYEEHEAFGGTFAEWQQIKSVWDRRSVLFQHWDESEFAKLQKWQIIERYTKDRYGLKAIEFQKTNITNDDFQDIRLVVALSKLYRAMDSYDNALRYAKGAYELRPDLDIVKIEYANVLHLSNSENDKELSHKIFNEVLEKRIKESEEKSIALLNYFMFSPNYIDSSVFAVSFLLQGDCDIETWEKLAEEYYWCPVFRYEHSVFLNSKGETLRAMAKLNSLANEFPWYKTGVLACVNTINQMREQRNDKSFMSNEMKQMKEYKKMWNN